MLCRDSTASELACSAESRNSWKSKVSRVSSISISACFTSTDDNLATTPGRFLIHDILPAIFSTRLRSASASSRLRSSSAISKSFFAFFHGRSRSRYASLIGLAASLIFLATALNGPTNSLRDFSRAMRGLLISWIAWWTNLKFSLSDRSSGIVSAGNVS